ncbi:MAG: hypothetical protein CL847_06850 [Crocinitomicaceae bacterium]|nr:hypothetical protein [Crocinitomicaceae bacterium]|tara:strand:+ start:1402 stop:3033 length:1632 start_codon:yes stop_codon:yes gene_type:complete
MQRLFFAFLACLISVTFHLQGQEFIESHLPIVVIEYENEIDFIPDEPRVLAVMGIINNGDGEINHLDDPHNEYSGNIGIETRGNSTQMFEKKTYTIELWDNNMADQSLPILGMGEEEDWILHAMVIDKTQFRIPLSFDLAREMGHYASNYRFVELVMNNEYRGLYILTEKIKRDNNRVDIAKLDINDIEGRAVTGGYILRVDWTWDIDDYEYFTSNYESQGGELMKYQYYYPKADDIQQNQKDYIKEWMDDFENAVFSNDFFSNGTRYTELINVTSFTDFLIINELSKNSDGYKLSTYMHKDRIDSDERLHAGPIWDFDQTYGMSAVCSNYDPTGWTYLQEQEWCEDLQSMPMFWQSMMSDTVFTNHLSCRWSTLRQGPLHIDSLFHRIDEMNTYVGEAITRNFIRWDFQGENIWIEPYPLPLDSHEEEVEYMKNWIQERIEWLDVNMPGNCMNDVISKIPKQEGDLSFRVFPNPASNNLTVDLGDLNGLPTTIKLFDPSSKLVIDMESNSTIIIDVAAFAQGLYTLEISTSDKVLRSQVVIE